MIVNDYLFNAPYVAFHMRFKTNERKEENRNGRKTFVTAILKYVFEHLNKRTNTTTIIETKKRKYQNEGE